MHIRKTYNEKHNIFEVMAIIRTLNNDANKIYQLTFLVFYIILNLDHLKHLLILDLLVAKSGMQFIC
jgi:hypothetical protein